MLRYSKHHVQNPLPVSEKHSPLRSNQAVWGNMRRTRPQIESLEDRRLLSFDFAPAVMYGAGSSFLTMGDLNGDGQADLVASDTAPYGASGGVIVLLGQTQGGFGTPARYPTNQFGPRGVALGDFNGDGRMDVVTANDYTKDGSISILLGNGDGTLQASQTIAVGASTDWVAVDDFNGDGKSDVAVTKYFDSDVTILLGHGDGTFGSPVAFPVDGGPLFVLAADFNGDGKQDLATANVAASTVSVLLGNGDGTLQAAQSYRVANIAWTADSLAVGDFNGDGKADLAVGEQDGQSVAVLVNRGDATFQDAVVYPIGSDVASVATADFNGDGKLDIAAAGYGGVLKILPGNGDGTFGTAVDLSFGDYHGTVLARDFDRDGAPDLIVGDADGVGVRLNQPATVRLEVSGAATGVVGSPFTIRVDAQNTFGGRVKNYRGTVHFTTTGSTTVLPADYTFTDVDLGSHTITVVPREVGSLTVTATDEADAGLTDQFTTTINPGAADHFVVNTSASNIQAGASFTVTVTAQDRFGDVATGYSGIVHFESTDAAATLPSDYRFTPADNGTHSFSVTLKAAETSVIRTRDTSNRTVTGETSVVISAAAFDHFRVDAPAIVTTGVAFDLTVTAMDAFNNWAGYIGAVHVESTDPTPARLPADYTFVGSDHGQHTFPGGAVLFRLGSQAITITVNRAISGSVQVSVKPPTIQAAILNPSSDTGVSHTDGITNMERLNFIGTATPGSLVSLFADRMDTPIGQAITGVDGGWSVTTNPLPDGTYSMLATASTPLGVTGPVFVVMPSPSVGALVIDTVGPRVTAVALDRRSGRVTVSFLDDRAGLDVASLLNPSNFTIGTSTSRRGRRLFATGLAAPSGASPRAAQSVSFRISDGRRRVRPGQFLLTIHSGGVSDRAGNALDGEFSGAFPSGDGRSGGDFRTKVPLPKPRRRPPRTRVSLLARVPVDGAGPLADAGQLPAPQRPTRPFMAR
jgi:Bacterial Ig-like domain/FG-GAP-like repeat